MYVYIYTKFDIMMYTCVQISAPNHPTYHCQNINKYGTNYRNTNQYSTTRLDLFEGSKWSTHASSHECVVDGSTCTTHHHTNDDA